MLFRNKKRYVVHTLGDPVLREVARPVGVITPELRLLAEKMIEVVKAFEGVGLAAPQVGESVRMVVLNLPMESMSDIPSAGEKQLLPEMPLVVVNPEIISSSPETECRDEGCLSLPDVWAPVERPSRVFFRAMPLDGKPVECECGGLLGRCIQHELDHLDGKLFVDRVEPVELGKVERELRQLQRYGEKHHFHRIKVK